MSDNTSLADCDDRDRAAELLGVPEEDAEAPEELAAASPDLDELLLDPDELVAVLDELSAPVPLVSLVASLVSVIIFQFYVRLLSSSGNFMIGHCNAAQIEFHGNSRWR